MKKVHILFIILFLFVGFSVSAQNQNKLFADFGNGSYTTFKSEISYDYNNTKKVRFDQVSKPWPITIALGTGKDFDGNALLESVTVARQGVIKEKFIADIPENPVYFQYKDFRLSVIGDKIYYYQWNNDNATIVYLLTKSGVSSYNNELETINNHVRNSFKNQQGSKGKIAEVKEANAKKEAAENSLKGKTVKSLEIVMVDVPQELGCRSSVKFGIKATLTDGKTFSTTNIGGKTSFEDFNITTTDGTYVDDGIEIHEDASKITNDELNFTVSSKYTPNVKVQKTIPLNYAFSTFDIKHNGKADYEIAQQSMIPGVIKAGTTGRSLELKIEKAVTKKTNLPIYKVELIDALTGKTINRYKLSQNTILNVYANGGSASNGVDRKTSGAAGLKKAGDGSNGSDGGNITVSKSADASAIMLNIFNKASKGGKGGQGVSLSYNGSSGRDGVDGKIISKLLTQNLSW